MSQQAVSRRRGGRRWRAHAVLRKQRTDRVRRLKGLAVVVLLRSVNASPPPPLAADVVRLIAIDLLGSDDGLESPAPWRLEYVLAKQRIRFISARDAL
jgi:hypothetical protein